MSIEPSDPSRGSKIPRAIAKRMAMAFGLVSVVAVVMCALLITLLSQVAGQVEDMRDDEAAIKASLALATSIREQYIHQAHWIIERDDKHLHHYGDWLDGVRAGVQALLPMVPKQRAALKRVAQDSAELNRLFHEEIVPATRRGSANQVARLNSQSDAVLQRATKAADLIAQSVEQRMAKAHMSATRATTLGLLGGILCVVVVITLSVMFTIRLRRSVLTPLNVLAGAARRFGAGDFDSRVGNVGDGELLAVANAFDAMAEELEARESKLIESERMAAIGQLAAGVAHEINNPIQVIRGYLKTMTPESPRRTIDEELKILDEEAAACQRIAEDLVAYSHSPDLHRKPVAIDNLLRETARRFRETPEGSDVEVHVTAEAASCWSDAARLRQVLLNLLRNAAQVSQDGQRINVVGLTNGSAGYVISVEDRGPGISAEDKQRVFEPFFSKRAGGSGLGLAVSHGLVRAHGGSIAVEDRAGGGTLFRVHLPGDMPSQEHRA